MIGKNSGDDHFCGVQLDDLACEETDRTDALETDSKKREGAPREKLQGLQNGRNCSSSTPYSPRIESRWWDSCVGPKSLVVLTLCQSSQHGRPES